MIDLHLARLREQMALSRTLVQQLSAISTDLKTTKSVAVANLMEAMETISMAEQYFTPQQKAVLADRFQEHQTEWQEMLRRNCRNRAGRPISWFGSPCFKREICYKP